MLRCRMLSSKGLAMSLTRPDPPAVPKTAMRSSTREDARRVTAPDRPVNVNRNDQSIDSGHHQPCHGGVSNFHFILPFTSKLWRYIPYAGSILAVGRHVAAMEPGRDLGATTAFVNQPGDNGCCTAWSRTGSDCGVIGVAWNVSYPTKIIIQRLVSFLFVIFESLVWLQAIYSPL